MLARVAGADALVVAADRHAHRLRAMGEQLKRVGAVHAQRVALDATAPLPLAARFDRILVDAPCSGTGTLAGNPEIRWRLRPEDLPDLHRRQVAMLSHALEHFAPGGRMVYSTCSLEPEETNRWLPMCSQGTGTCGVSPSSRRWRRIWLRASPPRIFSPRAASSGTFPPEHHCDGFFAAVFERH